ncbi:RNA polymerase factor sigma-54 [Virgibacillus salexigens]|uniref:RNA polymerase factor sigma-54 n=1 Tax=Virgibacillus massiliensis TaxID=1462526 RepID=UPI00136DB85C|nr:RNA polymerase factor sigma-54 [Virgibacillus massiliensis]MYL40158.1 RNA polymerase factor sigma-54 [Virgibacillus massiliensis]
MKLQLVNEQVLKWKMNQSLMQSIQILQFSSIELMDYIKEVEKENPLIDEIQYQDDLTYYHSSADNNTAAGEINAKELNMYEQLKKQLFMLDIAEEIRPLVLFGIDSLNESGYLEVEMELWAEKCHSTINHVEQALLHIQSLEPAGIGARSLSECIRLQLDTSMHDPLFLEDLLENHLDWIAQEEIPTISSSYQLPESYISELLEEIKNCHPKPGQLLSTKQSSYIIPEASIFKESGKWVVTFFSWGSPTLQLNQDYKQLMDREKQTVDYLKNKWKQVEDLKKAISYRRNTLERVIQCIMEKQYLFFENGIHFLQPLTLREIAGYLDLHISTISRAISNKYVQTPNGVLPLNFFLQTGIQQKNGSKTSTFVIKRLITEFIDNENKQKPLSDKKLMDKLYQEHGIEIARRTIMKYRKQLNLPSSAKRKEN